MVALLKLEEKSRGGIFEKIDPFCFMPFLKILTKIAITDPLVLIDSPYDNKMLVNTIQEIVTDIDEWRIDLETRFAAEKEDEIVNEEGGLEVKEEDIWAVRVDFDRVNSDYFFTKKEDVKEFKRIKPQLVTVRPSYLTILDATI